jgi:hypothetical protein
MLKGSGGVSGENFELLLVKQPHFACAQHQQKALSLLKDQQRNKLYVHAGSISGDSAETEVV